MFKKRSRHETVMPAIGERDLDEDRAKRILVVTDNDSDRREIKKILGEDYELSFASDIDSAIEVYNGSPEIIRLVVFALQKSAQERADFLRI